MVSGWSFTTKNSSFFWANLRHLSLGPHWDGGIGWIPKWLHQFVSPVIYPILPSLIITYIYNITFKHEIMTTFGWSVPLNPLEFLAPNRCDLHPFGPPTMAAVDSAEPRTPRGKISEILKRKGAILKASFGKFRAMFKARLDEEWWGLLLST